MSAIQPWINLFELYIGPYSSIEEDRQFKAFFGCPPQVAEKIWVKYHHPNYLKDRSKLMVVLYFLKIMPTEDVGRMVFKLGSRNTYRKWLWKTLFYLNWVMSEVCFFFKLLKKLKDINRYQ